MNVQQKKIDKILSAKKAGLRPGEIVEFTGYSRTLVWAVCKGKAKGFEVDPFKNETSYIGKKGQVITRVDTQRGNVPVNKPLPPELVLIQGQQAEGLKAIMDSLTVKDQAIIQGRADGLSNEQIRQTCHTSYPYIKDLFSKLCAVTPDSLKHDDQEFSRYRKPRHKATVDPSLKGMKSYRKGAVQYVKSLERKDSLTEAEVEAMAYFETVNFRH